MSYSRPRHHHFRAYFRDRHCLVLPCFFRRMGAAVVLLLAFIGCAPALAEGTPLRIASWNIQNLGWGENKSHDALARIASRFDLLAIQELMDSEALESLRRKLEAGTGADWQALHSDALGSPHYREKYAFLWRGDLVDYAGGAVAYIDDAERFLRPPFSARFATREDEADLVLATVHAVHGDRVAERAAEVAALHDYWHWLEEAYPETTSRRVLLGDFNLPPRHRAWDAMHEVAEPLITSGATTLSTQDRRYANLYDNIWIPRDADLVVTGSGISPFPEILTATTGRYWSHEKARRHVSDHAPVHVLLNGAELHPVRGGVLAVPGRQESLSGTPGPVEPACIDLDTADADRLQELIHIGPERAEQITTGRPRTGAGALTALSGIGPKRRDDIVEQGLLCD